MKTYLGWNLLEVTALFFTITGVYQGRCVLGTFSYVALNSSNDESYVVNT